MEGHQVNGSEILCVIHPAPLRIVIEHSSGKHAQATSHVYRDRSQLCVQQFEVLLWILPN